MVEVSPPRDIGYSQIIEVVQGAYAWQFTSTRLSDYPVKEDASGKIIRLDEKEIEKRITELQESGFFSDKFIEGYSERIQEINEGFQNGQIVWEEGSQPSFLDMGDPWCHCQDYPENFWEWLSLHNLKILSVDTESIRVGAFWSFHKQPTDNRYYVEMILKDGEWKIDALQGFQ